VGLTSIWSGRLRRNSVFPRICWRWRRRIDSHARPAAATTLFTTWERSTGQTSGRLRETRNERHTDDRYIHRAPHPLVRDVDCCRADPANADAALDASVGLRMFSSRRLPVGKPRESWLIYMRSPRATLPRPHARRHNSRGHGGRDAPPLVPTTTSTADQTRGPTPRRR
jgi:hypothetical protein